MPKISYVTPHGREYEVDAQEGHSLMQVAVDNNIPGIDAQCGGACACATCHIYVRAEWQKHMPAPDDLEAGMLDFSEDEVRPTSRLACQIKITPELDGLIVDLPK